MAMPDREMILNVLRNMSLPGSEADIVTSGMVSDIIVSGNKVMFSLSVPAEDAERMEPIRQAAEVAVGALPGVESAMVALTSERKAGSQPAPVPKAPQTAATPSPVQAGRDKAGIPGVDAIIAIASGKGGVGKSTTAVNIALALLSNGLRVGILDADIYGPSLPRLLGIKGRPETVSGRILRPMNGHGLKVMSMGFLVEEDTPMIWRGPMVMSALTQMLREVAWGDLDVLIVDMPPGTGDAQLTMAQQVPLAGAIIVSTPQDLALIDARKGLNMFRRTEVPVLGIVENMSTFVCPACGQTSDIFGHGGAEKEAAKIGVPFLGAVPLHMVIRETSDDGTPIVAAEPDGDHATVYKQIAVRAWDQVAAHREGGRAAPRIILEK